MVNKYTVLIADIDPNQAMNMQQLCRNMQLIVIGIVSTGTRLISEYLKYKPDILIMEIALSKLDGVTALKYLIELGFKPKVIFVTIKQDPEYLKMGYDLECVDYIIKSTFFPERLERSVLKAVKQIRYELSESNDHNDLSKWIMCKQRFRNVFFVEDSIIYIEKYGRKTNVYFDTGEWLETTSTLKDIYTQTSKYIFTPYRGYLVNFNFIKSVMIDLYIFNNYEITLKNNKKIPLTRRQYQIYVNLVSDL